MQTSRLLTSDAREYIMGEWDGENRSGFQPLDDKVLVLMDEHSDRVGSIQVTDEMRERHNLAGETGLVVAIGPAAFVWDDEGVRAWTGRKPHPGDRVYCERYAGQLLQGADSRQYRLMSQRCIGAVAIPPSSTPK